LHPLFISKFLILGGGMTRWYGQDGVGAEKELPSDKGFVVPDDDPMTAKDTDYVPEQDETVAVEEPELEQVNPAEPLPQQEVQELLEENLKDPHLKELLTKPGHILRENAGYTERKEGEVADMDVEELTEHWNQEQFERHDGQAQNSNRQQTTQKASPQKGVDQGMKQHSSPSGDNSAKGNVAYVPPSSGGDSNKGNANSNPPMESLSSAPDGRPLSELSAEELKRPIGTIVREEMAHLQATQPSAAPSGQKQTNAKQVNAEQGNAMQRNAEQGNAGQGNTMQTNAEQGNDEQGNAEQGNYQQRNAEQGNYQQSNAEQGNDGQSKAQQGNAMQRNAEQGNAGQGNAGQGNYQQRNAEQSNAMQSDIQGPPSKKTAEASQSPKSPRSRTSSSANQGLSSPMRHRTTSASKEGRRKLTASEASHVAGITHWHGKEAGQAEKQKIIQENPTGDGGDSTNPAGKSR
jgi:hypothetical protein